MPVFAKTAAALCLLAAAPCAAPAAPAAASPDARAQITAALARIDTALEHKEWFGVTAFCTPAFVSINDKGQSFNAADVRAGLAHDLTRARAVQSATDIQSMTPTPSGAVVVIVQHLHVDTPYRAVFFSRTAHTTVDQTRREEWAKTLAGWQLTQSRTLSSQTRTRY